MRYRRLVDPDDPLLRAQMRALIERAYRNRSPEEREAALWHVDHPPPPLPIGSPAWVTKQARLHMYLERARARRAAGENLAELRGE